MLCRLTVRTLTRRRGLTRQVEYQLLHLAWCLRCELTMRSVCVCPFTQASSSGWLCQSYPKSHAVTIGQNIMTRAPDHHDDDLRPLWQAAGTLSMLCRHTLTAAPFAKCGLRNCLFTEMADPLRWLVTSQVSMHIGQKRTCEPASAPHAPRKEPRTEYRDSAHNSCFPSLLPRRRGVCELRLGAAMFC